VSGRSSGLTSGTAPAVRLDADAMAGPGGITTAPFVLRNAAGLRIRGWVQTPPQAGPRTPVVVMAAGLGVTMQRMLLPALLLLTRGYRVVRYDPTNAAGHGDGGFPDGCLTGVKTDLVEVLGWAREQFGAAGTGAFAASLTGRAALRAAAENPGLVDLLGTIACVTDVRATIRAVTGVDRLAQWESGAVTDRDATTEVFGDVLRWNGYANILEDGWDGLASTRADLARAPGTRFVAVQGENDPWVSTADAVAAFEAADDARLVVMNAGVHELNFVTARVAVGAVADELAARLPAPGEPLPEAQFDEFVALGKVERRLTSRLLALDVP
jgi:predicted alpha/beta-hydrolase family hydrolase